MSVATDDRYTPEWLLDLVREFADGPIALDACTAHSNPTGAWTYYAHQPINGCGLRGSWQAVSLRPEVMPITWCNPPYSRGQVIRWARKAIEEARNGCEILMLTRADVRTRWFARLRTNMDQVCLINRSVGFVHPELGQLPGDTMGHALWYWGRRRARFRRVFEKLGWVLDGPGVQESDF